MLWHKDKGGSTITEEKETQKARRLSPRDQMIEQIEQIEPGKEITYRLGEIYVKPFITVIRNEKGKKFAVYQDGLNEAGGPAGKRGKLWDENHAKGIASWIIERGGGFYSG